MTAQSSCPATPKLHRGKIAAGIDEFGGGSMCGIAAAIDWDEAEATVGRLLKGLAHRGDVDDPVVSPFGRAAMGTRRLRIVDAERAIQPQASFDGRILVAFNGEIYNHAELRRELEAQGVAFRTASDTEVLASGLRIWGPKLLERLNGMYAFVALDAANGEFLAARDPFGVKPLYLIQSGPRYLFCSEMRPLLSATEEGDALLLPAGHLLTRKAVMRFASPFGSRPRIRHDPKKLDQLLAAAVHARLPPDLPCAMMFSGGIDSTLVAHYARQIRPDIPGYFLGDDRAPDYRYAALYAEETGFDLRRVPFDRAEDIGARIGEIVAVAETFEPSVVRESLCTSLISERIATDGYRVALSGEGADELFAGYAPLEMAFAYGDDVGAFVRDQCVVDMHRTNLQRLDRCSMRFGLEAREPFLDRAVADYALSLAAEDLLQGADGGAAQGKAPLRSLWALHPGLIPEAIRDRRKSPLHIGSGFDRSQKESPWIDYAEQTISDAEFAEGQKRFARFDLRDKEELLYLMKLAERFDVFRVPHLTARPRLRFPAVEKPAAVRERLADFLVEA